VVRMLSRLLRSGGGSRIFRRLDWGEIGAEGERVADDVGSVIDEVVPGFRDGGDESFSEAAVGL